MVPFRAISEGLGGAYKIVIACNGRTLTFDSSPLVESSCYSQIKIIYRSFVNFFCNLAFSKTRKGARDKYDQHNKPYN